MSLPKNIDNWEKLKKLAGYFQNDTDVTVELFQDEHSRMCFIRVGNEKHNGSSFDEALSKFEVEE